MGARLNGEGLTEPRAARSQISAARRVKGPFYICSFSKYLLGAYHVLSPVRGALGKGRTGQRQPMSSGDRCR